MSISRFTSKKSFDSESIEEFLNRGGRIIKCKTYGVKKYSSIPLSYIGQVGIGKTAAVKKGIDPQALLDAAVGTKLEKDVVNFLKSQGYEVN